MKTILPNDISLKIKALVGAGGIVTGLMCVSVIAVGTLARIMWKILN